ncbi:MAG: sigma-54-dependent Fis family transcriptional regulator, partial [Candidatus Marinimicrobia bacterium]|nr:sigma-54-dependent Fis family transcriptional regulator [Candidatus Neomarinimicrobiota bacterium]
RFELADGGTIFLDEISTVSPKTQIDLLRIVETKQVTRLGGTKPVDLDFRVVCATNENLETLVKEGKIREDLYYRINVFTIHIPPLRERRSDIPILAEHFAGKYSQAMNKPLASITDDAMDILIRHNWPGNVRELENVIERALVVSRSQAISIEDLPISLHTRTLGPDRDSLISVEKAHILRILSRTEWNITQTAKTLGIDRSTVYQKIKRYDLAKS